jgi:hypothetical protein
VLLYLRVRRPPTRSPRAELFRAFDALEEVLEHDLDPQERSELKERLRHVADQTDNQALSRLAIQLLDFLDSDVLKLSERRSSLMEAWLERWQRFEAGWVTRRRIKGLMAGGLLALGFVALSNMIFTFLTGPAPATLGQMFSRLTEISQTSRAAGLNWLLARILLETTVGLMLVIAAGLLIANRERIGLSFSYWSLLLSLTTVDLLVFYFDQFSAILTALIQFGILMMTIYYRRHYLGESG